MFEIWASRMSIESASDAGTNGVVVVTKFKCAKKLYQKICKC